MIIEIPNEKIIAWTGCHPKTPVKEAIIFLLENNRSYVSNFYSYVGWYAINKAMIDRE